MPSLWLKDNTAKKALQPAEDVSEVKLDGGIGGGDGIAGDIAGDFFETVTKTCQ
jgi:hypothetical protein